MHSYIFESHTNPGDSMYPEKDYFLQNVVVDHIDGVMAELLMHQWFSAVESEWTLS